ncbi:hypothetical protein PCASD_06814 [Puccinia coronata f. sp. avenae]|uniref:C2H2-type domain-containing protein n=1 Tax=Puccinia coronata f. sp. avenae TaxID=200324 RepID=A0A2N5UQC3_9BASI|nr:hypothetical protein PCASD_06814 [Puccinia coronata f. sp. avenae]
MEEGFTQWNSNKGTSYTCNHCGPRLMQEKQKKQHLQSAVHKRQVQNQIDNDNTPFGPGHVVIPAIPDSPHSPPPDDLVVESSNFTWANELHPEPTLVSNNIALAIDGMIGNTYFEMEFGEEGKNVEYCGIDHNSWMEYEMERICEDLSLDNPADETLIESASNQWLPFKNKMDLVGSLLVGYTRNLVSRTLFNQMRSILNSLCQLQIPAWSTVCRSQQRIRDHLNMEIETQPSVWGMPCTTLSSKCALRNELSNPLVAPFVDFYPIDSQHRDLFKLSQCQKWLDLPSRLRPQMCVNNTKHYYIFEPVQTSSNVLVVPIFFYILNSELCAKCICPTIKDPFQIIIPGSIHFSDPLLIVIPVKQFSQEYTTIKLNNRLFSTLCNDKIFEDQETYPNRVQLPNPWRIKAAGKIIRNMPIMLYSDDTSGNVLKLWNKHISFYFTLAGLEPRLSDQEFNFHFLTTSNRAGVLELSEMMDVKVTMSQYPRKF